MVITLDVDKYRSDLRQIEHRIVQLKRLLRTTWVRPLADEQRELCRHKQRATDLCALRAFSRGRIHRRTAPSGVEGAWSPEAYQRRIAERIGPAYSLAVVESA